MSSHSQSRRGKLYSKGFVPISNQRYLNQGHDVVSGRSSPLNEHQIDYLREQGFTDGLARSLDSAKQVFALRIWLIDNSESMSIKDGHRISDSCFQSGVSLSNRGLSSSGRRLKGSSDNIEMVECTRWEEISETVRYHVQLARMIESPTTFRLVNYPGEKVGKQQFSVCLQSGTGPYDVQNALNIMKKVTPKGFTLITSHVLDIYDEVKAIAPKLSKHNSRVVIVIATDGLPTDETGVSTEKLQREFVDSLRCLEGLPIWVVIRLCTDEEKVVHFYNQLDNMLDLEVEVLDDFVGEATEVYNCNPWLNYALPLHRLREMGFHDRLLDMLDERLLEISELRNFCKLIFGKRKCKGIPDPQTEWLEFLDHLENLLDTEKLQWNPIDKEMKPWINLKKLGRIYGKDQPLVEI